MRTATNPRSRSASRAAPLPSKRAATAAAEQTLTDAQLADTGTWMNLESVSFLRDLHREGCSEDVRKVLLWAFEKGLSAGVRASLVLRGNHHHPAVRSVLQEAP
jgi:hypothetical protein